MREAQLPPQNQTPPTASESRLTYERSKTFLARLPDPGVFRLRATAVIATLLLFFVVVPVLNVRGIVPDYKVNVLGKYLSLALVALGIDLIWGYTGLLSLCQALFFCIGAYAMAMHLSLPQGGGDVRSEYHNIPQFMFFNNVSELPIFWRPFASMPLTLLAGVCLSALVAAVFGYFVFRSRVRGVYFSIITQAVAWGMWLLISRNEMLLGGTNGLTNFYKPMTQSRTWILGLYLLTLASLVLAYLLCWQITRSKLGRVLIAIRDKESRLYFAGYRPHAFKVFAFAVAAALAAAGGMLYAPQTGIVTPQNMNVEASITMVIWVALGGRGKLWGAVLGSLLVNYMYSAFTSDMPEIWPFIYGGMFIGAVLVLPDGVVGVWDQIEKRIKVRDWPMAGLILVALLALVGFVLGEALGLVPHSLQAPLIQGAFGNVAWKHLLLALSVAVGLAGGWLSRTRGRSSSNHAMDTVQTPQS